MHDSLVWLRTCSNPGFINRFLSHSGNFKYCFEFLKSVNQQEPTLTPLRYVHGGVEDGGRGRRKKWRWGRQLEGRGEVRQAVQQNNFSRIFYDLAFVCQCLSLGTHCLRTSRKIENY